MVISGHGRFGLGPGSQSVPTKYKAAFHRRTAHGGRYLRAMTQAQSYRFSAPEIHETQRMPRCEVAFAAWRLHQTTRTHMLFR